jgi:hypothetical protein
MLVDGPFVLRDFGPYGLIYLRMCAYYNRCRGNTFKGFWALRDSITILDFPVILDGQFTTKEIKYVLPTLQLIVPPSTTLLIFVFTAMSSGNRNRFDLKSVLHLTL